MARKLEPEWARRGKARGDAGAITGAALLLHGTADRIIPATHASWLAAHCPTAELRLCQGDSHFAIVTHAESGLEWLRQRV